MSHGGELTMKKTLTTLITTVLAAIALFIGTPVNANAASESIIGCSIRTTEETVGYYSSCESDKLAVIAKDTKLVVEAEANGRFLVNLDQQYLWIDSKNVLVNIAEYIPSLDIRLAMAQEQNFFQMADQAIDGLTNKQFYTAEGSINGSEAWLKYEPAKKLAIAQDSFLADGYSIVIYDAYRPYSATKSFQAAYRNFLNQQSKSFKSQWFGELGESWFLAQKASSHNYGVAIDMSLKTLDGQLVSMPSAIHTLDKRSAICEWKNANTAESKAALYMKTTMENAGFSYLKSEWWHFQDNQTERGSVIDIAN